MRKIYPLIAILFFISNFTSGQGKNYLKDVSNFRKLRDINNSSASELTKGAILFLPIGPSLIVENDKVYFGLTKEFSIGKFPYGRLAAEYTIVARETHINQLRFSYNIDIPVEVGDLAAFLLSVGGGYFTDFSKQGYFPQVSFNLLLPAYDAVAVCPYIKVRNTFMNKKEESDIFDFSIGISTILYL